MTTSRSFLTGTEFIPMELRSVVELAETLRGERLEGRAAARSRG